MFKPSPVEYTSQTAVSSEDFEYSDCAIIGLFKLVLGISIFPEIKKPLNFFSFVSVESVFVDSVGVVTSTSIWVSEVTSSFGLFLLSSFQESAKFSAYFLLFSFAINLYPKNPIIPTIAIMIIINKTVKNVLYLLFILPSLSWIFVKTYIFIITYFIQKR